MLLLFTALYQINELAKSTPPQPQPPSTAHAHHSYLLNTQSVVLKIFIPLLGETIASLSTVVNSGNCNGNALFI